MKQYNIHLRDRITEVGIHLRDRITEVNVAICELTIKYNTAARADLDLLASKVLSGTEKLVSICNTNALASSVSSGDISAVVAEKTVDALSAILQLTSSVSCTLEYTLGTDGDRLILSAAMNALLTKYRLLRDMDHGTESGSNLILNEFDNMTLEDIDFIVIK